MAKKLKNDTQVMQSKHANFLAIVKNEKQKFSICAGPWKIVEREFNEPRQAEEFIGTKPYELIFNLISLMIKINDDEKAKQNEVNPQKSSENK